MASAWKSSSTLNCCCSVLPNWKVQPPCLKPSAPPGSSMTPSRVTNSETMTFLMGFASLSYSIGCLRGSLEATVQVLSDPCCAPVRSVRVRATSSSNDSLHTHAKSFSYFRQKHTLLLDL